MDIYPVERHLRLPSPLQKLQFREGPLSAYKIWIKRDECIHPVISGNKWRKLKNILLEADSGHDCILSFGGPYSNHLVALAGAGNYLGLKTFGFIRTRDISINNPSLERMKSLGMEIIPLTPGEYADYKSGNLPLQKIVEVPTTALVIPEGGSAEHALKGVAEIIGEIELQEEEPMDYLFTAAGTGTTAMGLAGAFRGKAIFAVTVFKEIIKSLPAHALKIKNLCPIVWRSCQLNLRFAGRDSRVSGFIEEFYALHGIWLDSVYTARTFLNMQAILSDNQIPEGSNIVFYHSGGLQGDGRFNVT